MAHALGEEVEGMGSAAARHAAGGGSISSAWSNLGTLSAIEISNAAA